MDVKKVFYQIFINLIPILLMIALIPFIRDDYFLSLIYIGIIIISFFVKYDKKEYIFFIFGFFIMIIVEYFFISTGVEIFKRNTLFGVMPIWLPIIWAYSFVAMKRALKILDM